MVDDQIPQYAELLRHLFLFKGLDTAQIAHLVTRFQVAVYEKDQVVFTEDSARDRFFLIFSGRVKLSRREDEGVRWPSILGKGEYFGEEALLFDRPQSATVTAIEPTTLLYLDSDSFDEMLQEFPRTQNILSVTADSRQIAYRENFDWLGTDEVIYIVKRKHEIFLLTAMLLPIFTLVISIPILAIGLTSFSTPLINQVAFFAGIFGILGSLFWAVWRWVDWGNDYYVATNQRVLRLIKVVLLYTSRREAPLNQILAVNVTKTFFGRMLEYGSIDVRTFTGGIRMSRVADPDLFAAYVDGLKERAGYFGKQAEREAIRRALRERLGIPVGNGSVSDGVQAPRSRRWSDTQKKPSRLRNFFNRMFVVRYEQGDVITYRKHWNLLLRKIWLPTFLLIMIVFWTGLQINNLISGQPGFFSSTLMFAVYFLIALGLIGWWIYGYADWSNDIYQLAPDQIRDIERKPLGDEMKKTAPLESILSLEHSRDGIIQLAFNYGYVVINVGETRFIFRGVPNPDQVHQDISDYIEALNRRKQEVEAARERERMLNWLTTYKDEAQLLEIIESEADWDIFPG
ncbi:MAG: cyclic nucleotide-binding domain-containing protein [Anaerolineales bacterium]